jgi:hypothetical protein
MQTRQPKKRVNWIFVIILLIVVPLLIVTLVMMNTISDEVHSIPENPRHPVPSVHDDTTNTESIERETNE